MKRQARRHPVAVIGGLSDLPGYSHARDHNLHRQRIASQTPRARKAMWRRLKKTLKRRGIELGGGPQLWITYEETGSNPRRRRGKLSRRRVRRNGYAGNDFAKAKKQAQANADYFAEPYVVFRDSSGRLRVERTSSAGTVAMRDGTVVRPNAAKYRSEYYGGELYGPGMNPRSTYKYKTVRYFGYLMRTYEPGEVAVYGSGRANAREKLITVASITRAKTWIDKRRRRIGRN